MKKLTLFLIPMFLFSCNSIEKYRAPIEEAAELWGETTKKVTDFSEKVNGTISDANNMTSQMMLDKEMVKEKGKDGEMAFEKVEALKTEYAEALKGFTPIQESLSSMMKTWGDHTQNLTNLTEGLAAGQLDGDVMTQVTELKETANNASETIDGLQEQFNSANDALQGVVNKWKETYGSMTSGEEG